MQLGRYEVLNQLGQGSMGKVFRARDSLLDCEVALKTISTGPTVEPEIRERFLREAKACARLKNHPGIVAVSDLGEDGSTAFIAMELLIGSDFRKIIERKDEVSVAAKLQAMIVVCQALAHAHRHGITHRDIKPSNLFLLEDGRAKILDFGIARLPTSQLTVAGKILGTPNYMAPEQIGSKPTDSRSDLFSAAVVFFEFLVYKHPFQSKLIPIPQRIAESDPDSLFNYDTTLPYLLERVFLRGLAKNPADRYSTGDEFANDLKVVLDSIGHNASPSFGGLQLPSEREPIVTPVVENPAVSPDRSLLREVPPGEDPHEWRLSEVLVLIPEFEGAVDRRDRAAASKLFRELVTIQSIDPRFSEAVELCRSKLETLDISVAQQSDPPSAPKFCVSCRAQNRSAAMFCIKCGVTFVKPQPTPQPQPVPEPSLDPPSQWDGSTGYDPPVPSPPAPSPLPKPAPEPSPSKMSKWLQQPTRTQKRNLIIGTGCLALAVLAGVGLTYLTRPIPVEASAATALIAAAKSVLVKSPNDLSPFVDLATGQKLNILQLPQSGQEWVRAQFVPSPQKASRAGFIRIADLRTWESRNPDDQLTLIRLFHGDGPAGGQGELDALEALIQQYPDDQVARDAYSDVVRIKLDYLKNQIDRSQIDNKGDLENIRSQLTSFQPLVEKAGNDSTLRSQLEELSARLDVIQAKIQLPKPTPGPAPKPKPDPVPPKPSPAAQVEADLATAHHCVDSRDRACLRNAKDLANKVLRVSPQDSPQSKDASDLLQNIDLIERAQ